MDRDISKIALIYFKPNVYYVSDLNIEWNFNNIPKNIDIDILNKIDLNHKQKKIITIITENKVDLLCKQPFNMLNEDVYNYIKKFTANFYTLYKLFYKAWINEYNKQINLYINENDYHIVWYDFSSRDYTWAIEANIRLYKFDSIIKNELCKISY